jgi:hypothetical protein
MVEFSIFGDNAVAPDSPSRSRRAVGYAFPEGSVSKVVVDYPERARRMTYVEIAAARKISLASARRLVLRHHWPRQTGNDGLVKVTVPMTAIENFTQTAEEGDSRRSTTDPVSQNAEAELADERVIIIRQFKFLTLYHSELSKLEQPGMPEDEVREVSRLRSFVRHHTNLHANLLYDALISGLYSLFEKAGWDQKSG